MLTRMLIGPLFGAALTSGWWAWALWAEAHPTVEPHHPIVGLVVVSAVYALACCVCAVMDLKVIAWMDDYFGHSGPVDVMVP